MGYGILLNRYTNTLLYPQVHQVGMEFKTRAFGVNIHGFTNDFKENMGLAGSEYLLQLITELPQEYPGLRQESIPWSS